MAKRRNEGTELETGRTDSGEAVYTNTHLQLHGKTHGSFLENLIYIARERLGPSSVSWKLIEAYATDKVKRGSCGYRGMRHVWMSACRRADGARRCESTWDSLRNRVPRMLRFVHPGWMIARFGGKFSLIRCSSPLSLGTSFIPLRGARNMS